MTDPRLDAAMSRRRFLGGVGMTAAGMAAMTTLNPRVRTGIGSLQDEAAASLGNVTLAFSWLFDVQQAGSYIAAQRKYYSPLNVTFLPGGDSFDGEPLVMQGKALCAETDPTTSAAANNQGASVVLVGAQYQTNPFCVMSLHKHLDLAEPKDLIGKTVGYGPNMAVPWFAWLDVNGIKSKVHSLLTSRDASILTSGGCDAYVGWVTSDVLGLVVQGEDVDYLLFGDTGLKLFDLTYCVAKSALQNAQQRQQVIALLKGEIRGWQVECADQALGLDLTMNVWGKHLGLNEKVQQMQSNDQVKLLIQNSVTKQHGLFWMSEADIEQNIRSLNLSKVPATKSLFDNSLLAEIYDGKSTIPL
jgi:ABC-type nitrate/sulfonate/bicarbonate transport system substrate-binding protein